MEETESEIEGWIKTWEVSARKVEVWSKKGIQGGSNLGLEPPISHGTI